jgi:hypothetical protein
LESASSFHNPEDLPGQLPFPAFSLPASCAQDVETRPSLFVNDPYPYTVSEDCLYLNIFTPGVVRFCGQFEFKFKLQYNCPLRNIHQLRAVPFPSWFSFMAAIFKPVQQMTGPATFWPVVALLWSMSTIDLGHLVGYIPNILLKHLLTFYINGLLKHC